MNKTNNEEQTQLHNKNTVKNKLFFTCSYFKTCENLLLWRTCEHLLLKYKSNANSLATDTKAPLSPQESAFHNLINSD